MSFSSLLSPRYIRLSMVVVLVSMTVLAGCSSQQNPRGQDTPSLLMRKLVNALLNNDQEKFLECCIPKSDEWQAAQKACLDYAFSVMEFKRALVKTNGPDAWKQFMEIFEKQGGIAPVVRTQAEYDSQISKIEMSPDGQSAIYRDPDGFPLLLKKKDNVWYYDYTSGAVRPAPKEDKKQYQKSQRVVETVTEEIKASNLKPEQAFRRYNEEVGRWQKTRVPPENSIRP